MCSFLVIKHSWKGKYKRVFCIGALSITTYNPSTMEATNSWQYSDFITILPAARGQASQPNNEFIITFKKGKKTDSMRFSSDHRAAIITETMRWGRQSVGQGCWCRCRKATEPRFRPKFGVEVGREVVPSQTVKIGNCGTSRRGEACILKVCIWT
jgi:hypothetical protein